MFNERSVAVLDAESAAEALRTLLKERARFVMLRRALHASRALPNVQLADGGLLRNVVAKLDAQTRQQLFAWTATQGPFHEDFREDIDDDLFFFDSFEVTEEGLGEAARQQLFGLDAASFSLPNAFDYTPITVIQGFADDPIASIEVKNTWDGARTATEIEVGAQEPTSWAELLEEARARLPALVIGNHCDAVLSRQSFEPAAARQILVRLGDLHRFVEETGPDGAWTDEGQRLYQSLCTGKFARFSDEAPGNKRDFKHDMTFPDPLDQSKSIVCFWHGKIQTPQYRIHYEWPVPPPYNRLRIAYIGPKISKR